MFELLFLGMVVAIIAAVWRYDNADARARRALKGATATTVAEFPDGALGKLVGTVGVHTDTLVAPLSGRPCVAWQLRVRQKRGKHMATIIEDDASVTFTLEDASGRAIVEATQARFVVVRDVRTKSGMWDDATPEEHALLERYGKHSTGLVFNKATDYREGVIEPGERVAVFGFGMREPDPDGVNSVAGYRGEAPTRLRISGSRNHQVLVSDDPRTIGVVPPTR